MDHALSPRAALTTRPLRPQWWLLYAVAAAGLALCLTTLWTGMREVMAVGGACADGGPYVAATPCPDGVALLIAPAAPLGFVAAGLLAWAGSRIAAGSGALAFLAWPALFLSLGWNFLEFGLDPAGGGGKEWGLLTCAAVFALMGAPALGFLPGALGRLERRAAVVVVFALAAAGGVLGGLAVTAAVTS